MDKKENETYIDPKSAIEIFMEYLKTPLEKKEDSE